jgi:hypothetical protein
LRSLADGSLSNGSWLVVLVGHMSLLEIVSSEPCKLKRATPGDQFRLVIGLVEDTPNSNAKILGSTYATQEPQKLKFRAILQFNPFTKTYTYVTGDYGQPEAAVWLTESVATIISN